MTHIITVAWCDSNSLVVAYEVVTDLVWRQEHYADTMTRLLRRDAITPLSESH